MKQVPFDWGLILSAHVTVHIQSQEDFLEFCGCLPREVFHGDRHLLCMSNMWDNGLTVFRFCDGKWYGEGAPDTYLDGRAETVWPDLVFTEYKGTEMSVVEVGDLL